MAFGFKKRQKFSPEQELSQLRSERLALETEYSEKREIADLKKKVKEDRKILKQLKTELHPSVYRKFGKFLLLAGKGTAVVTKEAWNEYMKYHRQLHKEKAHAKKRKRALREVS